MQTPSNSINVLPGVMGAGVSLAAGAGMLAWLLEVVASVAAVAVSGAPVGPDEALVALAATAAAALLLWTGAGLVLEVAGLLPGVLGDAARSASAAFTPRLVRRAVGLVLGAGVAAGLGPGASLAEAPAPRPSAVASALPLPDPAWAAPDGATGLTSEPGEVAVRRGDTLWAIAASHLGTHPADAEIARAWPAWHDANRRVIGDDPDLILPGQVLRPPEEVAS